jgi:hypothetical protein
LRRYRQGPCSSTGKHGRKTRRYILYYFFLTPQPRPSKILFKYLIGLLGDAVLVSRLRGNSCAICPAGRYSASIQIAPLADTGCGPTPHPPIIAAIAANSSATFRHPLVPGCECGLGRSAGTGRGCDHARDFGSSPLRHVILTNPLQTQNVIVDGYCSRSSSLMIFRWQASLARPKTGPTHGTGGHRQSQSEIKSGRLGATGRFGG